MVGGGDPEEVAAGDQVTGATVVALLGEMLGDATVDRNRHRCGQSCHLVELAWVGGLLGAGRDEHHQDPVDVVGGGAVVFRPQLLVDADAE